MEHYYLLIYLQYHLQKITTKQNRETPKIPENVDRNESLDTLLKQEQYVYIFFARLQEVRAVYMLQ